MDGSRKKGLGGEVKVSNKGYCETSGQLRRTMNQVV